MRSALQKSKLQVKAADLVPPGVKVDSRAALSSTVVAAKILQSVICGQL